MQRVAGGEAKTGVDKHGGLMCVRLEPLTRDNWYECSRLEVKPEQRDYVASNLLCIAEVQFYPSWRAYPIYTNDRMVGFVMYEHDEEQNEWWISALMIVAAEQGKGYGKAALQALLPLMKEAGCREVFVGYANENDAARTLYRSLEFIEVDLDDEGDMVAKLQLRD
jgi:diamine N-acetyltransferase